VAEEEAGVDDSRGDQWSRERRGLRDFGMKRETIWGGLLFIGLKISAAVLN
jgi:hypothetical protein